MGNEPKKNSEVNKARREAKRDKRKEKKQKAHLDKDGFTMPQVPQNRGQLFDPAKLQQRIAENQQEILQTPAAKQRNKDKQDPFKNGYFKPTSDQSMSKRFNPAQGKEDVRVAQEEQTNAQKLFAPAVPDIQTDKAGNKLASRNGKPVGFSGTPKGAASPSRMSPQGLMDNPNQSLYGMTDAESAANQSIIQNVAANFEPYQLPQPTQAAPSAPIAQTPPSLSQPQSPYIPTQFPKTETGLPMDTPGIASEQAREGRFNFPLVLPQTPQVGMPNLSYNKPIQHGGGLKGLIMNLLGDNSVQRGM